LLPMKPAIRPRMIQLMMPMCASRMRTTKSLLLWDTPSRGSPFAFAVADHNRSLAVSFTNLSSRQA